MHHFKFPLVPKQCIQSGCKRLYIGWKWRGESFIRWAQVSTGTCNPTLTTVIFIMYYGHFFCYCSGIMKYFSIIAPISVHGIQHKMHVMLRCARGGRSCFLSARPSSLQYTGVCRCCVNVCVCVCVCEREIEGRGSRLSERVDCTITFRSQYTVTSHAVTE